MKKKISLPIVITIVLLVAAIVFSAAYMIATNSMNRKLKDLGEKQSMFSILADVDSFVREKSYYKPEQTDVEQQAVKGYIEGYDGRVLWLSSEEYENSKYESAEYMAKGFADGSVVVVLTEEQYNALNGKNAE